MTFSARMGNGGMTTEPTGYQHSHPRCGPALTFALVAALAMTLVPWRAYALPVCTSGILACCKITSGGSYTVTAGFTASGPYTACIKIMAAGVSLDGGNNTIDGLGSMDGLVIDPGASGASVFDLNMSGFETAMEVDANGAMLSNGAGDDSTTGVVINGKDAILSALGGSHNTHNGIVINGRGFTGFSVGASYNHWNGIVVNSTATGAYIFSTVDDNNAKAGLKIKAVTSGLFQGADNVANGWYGVWLRGSSGVSVLNFTAYENSIAGVYLGCHPSGPSSTPCPPGVPPTNANTLASTFFPSFATPPATADGGSVQKYGVVIDQGNYLNHVIYVESDGNTAVDGYDGNAGCGSDTWHEFLGTGSQYCVVASSGGTVK